MFDLENTKTLPYFLYIWAKLEVGSKMGYLLTNGRDAVYGLWGVRARAKGISFFSVLHCVREARNDKKIWKSEALI